MHEICFWSLFEWFISTYHRNEFGKVLRGILPQVLTVNVFMVIFKRIIYDFFPQKNLRKRVINYKADLHIYKILNSKYRQLIKNKTKQHICSMAICELPGMLRTSRELSCIEKKTPLMSSKILTHNPAVFLCPTDLFAKHCHIKWWCFGKNTANTPCTPSPRWDGATCLRWRHLPGSTQHTASIPDSDKDQTLWY